jgi:hypothetical protein
MSGMSRYSAPLILALAIIIQIPVAASAQESPAPKKQQSRDRKAAEPKEVSMTGCIDEQEGGRYVLMDARSLAPLANLEAVGFPNEGFAKHLGNTVTVKGAVDSTGSRPVMRVRTVETVSNGCGQKN